jgi:polyisoprenoid-binding protein YceI
MMALVPIRFIWLLLAPGLLPAAPDSVVYEFAPAPLTRFEVRTGKAGLFGFAGHEHVIAARAFSGRVVVYPDRPAASRVAVTIPTDSLAVLTPPDTAEIRKVTQSMREDVLDVHAYPEIALVSQTVAWVGDTVRMNAALTLKGQTRVIPLVVHLLIAGDTLRASTTFAIKQTDFGIRPYRGGPGGTVRVADRVTFTIAAVAVRRPSP